MAEHSDDYMRGFTEAIIFAGDIFESRSNAFCLRKWLRKKDVRMIVAIIDAMFRARYAICNLGPRGMDLIRRKDGSFEFRDKEKIGEKVK